MNVTIWILVRTNETPFIIYEDVKTLRVHSFFRKKNKSESGLSQSSSVDHPFTTDTVENNRRIAFKDLLKSCEWLEDTIRTRQLSVLKVDFTKWGSGSSECFPLFRHTLVDPFWAVSSCVPWVKVEYAMEAISHAGAAVGIRTNFGVVLAAEKKILSKVRTVVPLPAHDPVSNSKTRTFVASRNRNGVRKNAQTRWPHSSRSCRRQFRCKPSYELCKVRPRLPKPKSILNLNSEFAEFLLSDTRWVTQSRFLWSNWSTAYVIKNKVIHSSVVFARSGFPSFSRVGTIKIKLPPHPGCVSCRYLLSRDKDCGFQLYQSDPSGNYAGWTAGWQYSWLCWIVWQAQEKCWCKFNCLFLSLTLRPQQLVQTVKLRIPFLKLTILKIWVSWMLGNWQSKFLSKRWTVPRCCQKKLRCARFLFRIMKTTR